MGVVQQSLLWLPGKSVLQELGTHGVMDWYLTLHEMSELMDMVTTSGTKVSPAKTLSLSCHLLADIYKLLAAIY